MRCKSMIPTHPVWKVWKVWKVWRAGWSEPEPVTVAVTDRRTKTPARLVSKEQGTPKWYDPRWARRAGVPLLTLSGGLALKS